MDTALTTRLRKEMAFEQSRKAPVGGFPALPPLPAERYTSREFFDLERRFVWTKSWLLVAREEDFPQTGTFKTYNLSGAPIVIVRGEDGRLRSFFNTCRHRGAPVVREPCGTARLLTCQFHAWTYNLQGQLVAVPFKRDFADFDECQYGLKPLRCASYDGWVFVSESSSGPSLHDFMGPLAEQWKAFKGETLRIIPAGEKRINCNWKLALDAFIETYHVQTVHKGTVGNSYDHGGCTIALFPHGHSRAVTPKTAYGLTYELGPAPGEEERSAVQLRNIAGLDKLVDEANVAYNLFPNLVVTANTIGIAVFTFWPVDVAHTDVRWQWFAPPPETKAQEEAWAVAVEQFNMLMDEDFKNLEPIQESISSGALTAIPFSYQERRIYHYHEEIDRQIGAERIAPSQRVQMALERFVERT